MAIKLLYITNGINGSGGLERVLSVKATMLAENFAFEVHILTLNEPAETKPFFEFSDKIIRHSVQVSGNPLKYWKQYTSGIRQKVKNINPDIISVCDDGLKAFFLPKVLGNKIPIIYERHASVDIVRNGNNALKNKLQHSLMKKLADDFTRFVVLTKGNLKEWSSSNVMVIPNPLPFVAEKFSNYQNKKIIVVGSHSYNKGTDLLMQIWKQVQPEFPDWSLEVYGKSTANQQYEKEAEQLNLKNIQFHKPVNNIQQKYAESSIMLLPSRSEGFGMVLIEAMSCGLPCVSFNCPHGPGDIISEGKDGFLIENGNIEALAEKLKILMNDEELRQTMGTAAKQSVTKYLPENIVKQWAELFCELLNNNKNCQAEQKTKFFKGSLSSIN